MFCRCRYDERGACALKFDASGMIVCSTGQGRRRAYDFEKIFPPNSTQDEVKYVSNYTRDHLLILPLGISGH